jgi:hypothetical protein
MLIYKEFKLPIYASNVVFVYGTTYKEIVDFCKKNDIDETIIKDCEKGYQGISFCVEDDKEEFYTYVIVKKHKDKYEEIDTITHEVTHVVFNILEYKDIKFDNNNSEPYAYLTGYLNKEFFKFRDGR